MPILLHSRFSMRPRGTVTSTHHVLYSGGNAYLHWKLAKFFEADRDPERAEDHCQKAVQAVTVAISLLRKPSSNGISFYIGNAGEPCNQVDFMTPCKAKFIPYTFIHLAMVQVSMHWLQSSTVAVATTPRPRPTSSISSPIFLTASIAQRLTRSSMEELGTSFPCCLPGRTLGRSC